MRLQTVDALVELAILTPALLVLTLQADDPQCKPPNLFLKALDEFVGLGVKYFLESGGGIHKGGWSVCGGFSLVAEI